MAPTFCFKLGKELFHTHTHTHTHTHDKNQRKAASETVKLKVGPCEVSFSFFQGLGSVSVRGVVGPAVMCF